MKLTTAKLLLSSVAIASCAFGGALVAAPGIAGMSTAPATVLASGDDDFEDFCDHYDGEHKLPGNNGVFQHPCQSKNNSVGRGTIGILGHEYSR